MLISHIMTYYIIYDIKQGHKKIGLLVYSTILFLLPCSISVDLLGGLKTPVKVLCSWTQFGLLTKFYCALKLYSGWPNEMGHSLLWSKEKLKRTQTNHKYGRLRFIKKKKNQTCNRKMTFLNFFKKNFFFPVVVL